MKKKNIIVITILAVLAVLLVICIAFLPKIKDKTIDTAPSSEPTQSLSSDTGSLEPQSSSSIQSESSVESVTSASSSSSSTPAPTTNTDITKGNIPDSIWAKIKDLPRTSSGWGPGIAAQGVRPSAPVSWQNKNGKYGAYYIMPESQNIYLTFDEGYEYNNNTAAILDTLREKNVKAVFFVTYSYVRDNPSFVQRMIDEGHIVGNHSSAHFSYGTEPIAKCYDDLMKLHNYMLEKYNYEMKLFRFPMGESNEQVLAMLNELGYKSVYWSFAYRDWLTAEQPSEAEALNTILSRSHPGAIYLLHAVSNTNTAVLGQVIDELRLLGYTIAEFPQ